MKKKIAGMLMVMLCVVMQIVTLLPHHHHAGGGAPCFSAVHCGGHGHQCPEHASHCAGEDRHGCRNEDCNVTRIDATEPGRGADAAKTTLLPVALPADLHAVAVSCRECSHSCAEALALIKLREVPPAEDFYIACILPTLPGRAPAAMA